MILLCALYSHYTTNFNAAGIERTIIAATLGILGITTVFTFPHLGSKKSTFFWILLLCSATRIALLPAAPSDDINRYLWEGKLTQNGVSPYQGLAENEKYAAYRDQYWELMNNTGKPTAYPPLSMQIFRSINSISYSPMSYKVVFLLIDLAIITMLLALLANLHRPLHWALIYGLSPLTLLSFTAEGHFDVVMVAALVAALLTFNKRWFVACGIAVGIAVGVKLMAAVVAPILLWKTGWKGITAGFITLLLPLTFYWNDLFSVINALFAFGSKSAFNGPIHSIIRAILGLSQASSIVAICYVICWFIAFGLMLRGHLWSALLLAFGGLLVLSPIIHFWYLTWVLPLITLRPKLSWITLSVTFSLYFLVWHTQSQTGEWSMPLWARWMFWLPFMILLILELRKQIPRLCRTLNRDEDIQWTIVIPTYNADPQQLKAVLKSIHNQNLKPVEIIIANAGSTPELDHSELEIKIVHSELGRGEQIKTGVEAATASWVIIVHSDIVLPPHALKNLTKALQHNQHVIAGSLGQRFNYSSPGLLLIEAMNEFRSTTMHTSFGDQSQFFHRPTAIKYGALTEQKLMEDVEMSDRFNAIGESLYLGLEGLVSAEKWRKNSFSKRFLTIIEFMIRYRFCFSRKSRLEICEKFYKRYYG